MNKQLFRFGLLLVSLIIISACSEEQVNSDVRQLTADVEYVNQFSKLAVEIKENDVSVSISIRAADESKNVGITRITAPDKSVIFEEDAEFNIISEWTGNAMVGIGEVGVFLPPTPRLTLSPGIYIFDLFREDGVEVSSAVMHVKSTQEGEDIDNLKFAFDLNVWLVHSDDQYTGIDFQALVSGSYRSSINDALAPHGMTLRDINFYAADAASIEEFAVLDTDSEIRAACRALSSQANSNTLTLNLALVESLTSSDGAGIAGISASPGIIMDTTAGETCFFAAQDAFVADPEGLTAEQANQMQAATILHEAGHFMSLPHSSESDGLVFDYFDDTPECDIATFDGRDNAEFGIDGEKNGEISDHECALDGGADNFIFYSGSEDFYPYKISEQQAWVLRRHPLAIRVEE